MRDLLRDKLLNHIKTYDSPYYLYNKLVKNEVLFIMTDNVTRYGISSFENVLDLIKNVSNDSNRNKVLAFMMVNQNAGNKIVVFQEDYEPIMLFAFKPQEIERSVLVESEVI